MGGARLLFRRAEASSFQSPGERGGPAGARRPSSAVHLAHCVGAATVAALRETDSSPGISRAPSLSAVIRAVMRVVAP
jgi:hypothetical protein